MSNTLFSQTVREIRETVDREEVFFNTLNESDISSKLNRQNRSIKQIVGHLIDSASNNLHRIVHLQYTAGPLVFPNYSADGNNDRWIAIQHVQQEDWPLLVQLWKFSNRHLAHVVEHIDPAALDRRWIAAPGEEVSLREMVLDYPRHLKLHVDEIHEIVRS